MERKGINIIYFVFLCSILTHNNFATHSLSSYRQSSGSPSYRSSASSERSVAGVDFESGLDVVLSTQGGIKKFAEHCAREFSVENIRFWQAVNQYRGETRRHEERIIRQLRELLRGAKRRALRTLKTNALRFAPRYANALRFARRRNLQLGDAGGYERNRCSHL